ncbi:uncharacterized protein I303_103456 [Kwoniella dejecticola CBS 10117]|uniref:Uncharacterized protein n=1 Tax=Kwoniella dejecticola CBS 10117 TaxID=1296121 RepID=A0A1A6A6S6_9TREE|nr:uncharacterized protein I303_03479 [Kwoniella dejecticola CBS 10117]OBR85767.1 hypothetical protein I303_03479 [Kwoniella dejecticola CBS 10117]
MTTYRTAALTEDQVTRLLLEFTNTVMDRRSVYRPHTLNEGTNEYGDAYTRNSGPLDDGTKWTSEKFVVYFGRAPHNETGVSNSTTLHLTSIDTETFMQNVADHMRGKHEHHEYHAENGPGIQPDCPRNWIQVELPGDPTFGSQMTCLTEDQIDGFQRSAQDLCDKGEAHQVDSETELEGDIV